MATGGLVLAGLLCDQKTQERLGTQALAETAGLLYAGDCQTCGRALGTEPPALCVDDMQVLAAASLHHSRCRAPGWNDNSAVFLPDRAHLTWTSLSLMMPMARGWRPDPRATVLVNPGLEMIFLYPHGPAWRPGYDLQFDQLVLPGHVKIDSPVAGIAAWAADDLLSVTVEGPVEAIYEVSAPRAITDNARQHGGLLLALTHALDPGALHQGLPGARRMIRDLFRSGQVVCGWAALTPA
jgi:hypothetical protein